MREVHVIGRGVLSPAGRFLAENWAALARGVPAFTLDDEVGWLGRLGPAGEDALTALGAEKRLRHADRAVLMGVAVAREAWSEAKKPGAGRVPGKTAVIMGSSRGATATIEREFARFEKAAKVALTTSPTTTAGAFASTIAQDLALDGMALSVSSACSTGLNAIGVAYSLVASGLADHALAGGAEASLTPFTLAQLDKLGVRMVRRGSALYPCRPMHAGRSGLLAAEGAACLALTARPDVLSGKSLGRITGFGSATEGASLTGVSPDGQVLVDAIEQALEQAGLEPADVDLVCGHGSSTVKGDAAEMNAYRRVFGAQLPAMSFHKWLVGHMIGASAAYSAALASMALTTGIVHALPYGDEAELGFPQAPRGALRTVLVTAFGFGGNAAAMVLSTAALPE